MTPIPSNFTITLQKGITGGFAPPTPSAVYIIARQPDSAKFTTSEALRAHGTPGLSEPREKELELADHSENISKIQELLRDLPPQRPGAQDIYGKNISIVYSTGELAAAESYLSEFGRDVRQPTEEERERFDKAVGLIVNLAGSETLL